MMHVLMHSWHLHTMRLHAHAYNCVCLRVDISILIMGDAKYVIECIEEDQSSLMHHST